MQFVSNNKNKSAHSRQQKALNVLELLTSKLGIHRIHNTPSHYIQLAEKHTQLTNFGSYSPELPLKQLLISLQNEAELSVFGRLALNHQITRSLENHLRLEAEFQKNPNLENVDVEQPIIIVGTPGSGGTLLHNLLNRNHRVRTMKLWELHYPCPPPHPDSEFSDQRIALCKKQLEKLFHFYPGLETIPDFSTEDIQECSQLFSGLFTCVQTFTNLTNKGAYSDWLLQHDMNEAYREYKRYLKVLKYHYPNQSLVLRHCGHLFHLDVLEKFFPQARIIHLHRDPVVQAICFCNHTNLIQLAMRRTIDKKQIGEIWNSVWTPALLSYPEWREQTKLQVMDINFMELIRNPSGVVDSIFKNFDKDVSDCLQESIRSYFSVNQNKRHHWQSKSLEEYGLEEKTINQKFAEIIDLFSIQPEALEIN